MRIGSVQLACKTSISKKNVVWTCGVCEHEGVIDIANLKIPLFIDKAKLHTAQCILFGFLRVIFSFTRVIFQIITIGLAVRMTESLYKGINYPIC